MTLVKVRHADLTSYKVSAELLATLLPKMVADVLVIVKAEDVVVEVLPMAEWERLGHDLTIAVETEAWTPLRINLQDCTNRLGTTIKTFLYDIYGSGRTRPKTWVRVSLFPSCRVDV